MDFIKETETRDALSTIGYPHKFIDDRPPKITLYRHKPQYNVSGDIVKDAGTKVGPLPSDPGYILKCGTKLGQFQWPPSEACQCQWCPETYAKKKEVQKVSLDNK